MIWKCSLSYAAALKAKKSSHEVFIIVIIIFYTIVIIYSFNDNKLGM